MFSKAIKQTWLVLICLILLAACSSTEPEITPTATVTCGAFVIDGDFACVTVSSTGYLVQSPTNTQVTVQVEAAHITIGGTAYLNRAKNDLTIATLEGVSVVGANNTTRIIQPGAQITLPVASGKTLRAVDAPSPIYPFDIDSVQPEAFDQLKRLVSIPSPIAPPPNYTPPITPVTVTAPADNSTTAVAPEQVTIQPTICAPREDWTGRYTIQRGDTLSIIARRYDDMSMADLQNGNCLTDPDRIRAGQVLHLPEASTRNETSTPPTGTPTAVEFRAEQDTLQPGQCTTVTWHIENIKAVYFEEEATTTSNNRQVCPSTTTSYTLLVIYHDGSQEAHTLNVNVIELTDTPEPSD